MARINDANALEGGQRNPASPDLAAHLDALTKLEAAKLRAEWRRLYRAQPPKGISRDLLLRGLAYKLQERAHGGLSRATLRKLKALAQRLEGDGEGVLGTRRSLKPGARLLRAWGGETHRVLVLDRGFEYGGQRYGSLSRIARLITGAHWSGPRFFGVGRAPKPFSPSNEAHHE